MYGDGSSQHVAQSLHTSNSWTVEKFGADSVDHKKMTMRTLFAVRDKSPHRFRIFPLRKGSRLVHQEETSTGLDVPPTTRNHLHVHIPKLGSNSHTRPQSFSSRHPSGNKENFRYKKVETHDSKVVTVLQGPNCEEPKSVSGSSDYPARAALLDVDFNRAAGTLPSISMAFPGGLVDMYNLPSNNTTNLPAHSISPFTQHASHQDEKHQTLTTLDGIHISKIAQYYSSDDSMLLLSRRRNRALSITAAGFDNLGVVPDDLEMEIKLKRRHAIYRESYVPSLGQPRSSQSIESRASNNENDSSSVSCPESSVGLPSAKRDSLKSSNNGDVTKLTPVQYEEATARKFLQAPVASKESRSRPPASSEWISYRGPCSVRPLKLLNNSRSKPANVSTPEEFVYPSIIQDLFQDIEDAIHQWGKF